MRWGIWEKKKPTTKTNMIHDVALKGNGAKKNTFCVKPQGKGRKKKRKKKKKRKSML